MSIRRGDSKKAHADVNRRSPLIRQSSITNEIIKQKEELLKSVIVHSENVISQLLQNLREVEGLAKDERPPSHLVRLVRYLRDDIEPLSDLIPLIRLNAEKVGSLKAEYKLQREFSEAIKELYTTLSATRSHVECTYCKLKGYKPDVNPYAREVNMVGNTLNPRYITPSVSFDNSHDLRNCHLRMDGDNTALSQSIKVHKNNATMKHHFETGARLIWRKVKPTLQYCKFKMVTGKTLMQKNMYLIFGFLSFVYFIKLALSVSCGLVDLLTFWFVPKRPIPM